MLDLVKVKIRFGKSKIPLTMLVHDSAAMGYFHSPGLFEVAQKLEHKGFDLADQHITSDALTGIEILIGVDNFTRLIVRQKGSLGTSLFVTRGGRGDSIWSVAKVGYHNITTIKSYEVRAHNL